MDAFPSRDAADPSMSPELQAFLEAFAAHDWRRSYRHLPHADKARETQEDVLEKMIRCGKKRAGTDALPRILSRKALWQYFGQDDEARGDDTRWRSGLAHFIDALVVAQLGHAVKLLRDGTLERFDHESVPEDVFWRKQEDRGWQRQAPSGRYGWFSDAASVRALLAILQKDGTAARFCDNIGITKKQGNGGVNDGYGTVYFMFYTGAQLRALGSDQQEGDAEPFEFFRPLWSEMLPKLQAKFNTRKADLAVHLPRQWSADGKPLPTMWSDNAEQWDKALQLFKHEVQANVAQNSAQLVNFLGVSILHCKPMWDKAELSGSNLDPSGADQKGAFNKKMRYVCAVRHLLDQWFGANHLFMGDGYTWSADLKQGYSEYLVSSFANFDVERVSIFAED